MSSTDVENIAKTIEVFTNSSEVVLSTETLDNLISTIDNVHEKTELDSVRKSEASKAFRESAAVVATKLTTNSSETLKTGKSVGEFKIFPIILVSYQDVAPICTAYLMAPLIQRYTGFGVAEVRETNTSEKNNLLVLAGEVNTIEDSTNNIDDVDKVFFSVSFQKSLMSIRLRRVNRLTAKGLLSSKCWRMELRYKTRFAAANLCLSAAAIFPVQG